MTPAYFVYIQKDRRHKPEVWTIQEDIAEARQEARALWAISSSRVWIECNFVELCTARWFDE